MDELIEKLKALGFNSYEAKVYLALLKRHPATGYEVSKASGVPQARAYDTLKALEANRFVVGLGGKPATYSPISPEELLDRWERSFKGTVSHLREALPSLTDSSVDPMTNLHGEEPIFDHIRSTIQHTKQSLYLELWDEDAKHLQSELDAAAKRNVDIRIVSYGDVAVDKALIYPHGHQKEIVQALGGRWIVLTSDDEEGLLASFPEQSEAFGRSLKQVQQAHGVYTRNPGLVVMMKMLVVHDMFVLDIESNLRDEMKAVYGEGLLKLREKILGPNATIGFH